MATPEDLSKAAKETQAEFGRMLETVSSIADRLVEGVEEFNDRLDASGDKVDIIGKTMKRGLVTELKNTVKNQEDLIKLQIKAEKGEAKATDIAKQRQKVLENRKLLEIKIENIQKRKGDLSKEERQEQGRLINDIESEIDLQEEVLNALEKTNNKRALGKGLTGLIGENIKGYLGDLDKSGTLTAAFTGQLFTAEGAALGVQAVLIGFASAIIEAHDRSIAFQRSFGLTFNSAQGLQKSLAATADATGEAAISATDLNKSFIALAEETGVVSGFGGETLESFTQLNKVLGLSNSEAANLSLLSRAQGKNTEDILNDATKTVGVFNKQNGLAINARGILSDVADTSKAIQVSLGNNPIALAEAATAAKALGLSLNEVDQIAGSLLNFEENIAAQMQFEILSGKQINLEKARTLAMNNDMIGLTEEIKNNAALTETFTSGTRFEQEAAAAVLGKSREEMALMVQKTQFLKLGQEEYNAAFGEGTYEQMKSLGMMEELQGVFTKIKDQVVAIGIEFAPFIKSGLESVQAFLASGKALEKMKSVLKGLVTVAALLAGISLAGSVARIVASFASIPFGVGIPLGIAAAAGTIALATKARSMVNDGIADSSRGPFTITDSYGKMAMTAQGDNLAVSPNINQGGGSGDEKIISLLERLINRTGDVMLDGQKVGNVLSSTYRTISN
tara:strand:- start:30 stop:2066 length:2037 start_codon:yes stop_codon:yes gene_type:complete